MATLTWRCSGIECCISFIVDSEPKPKMNTQYELVELLTYLETNEIGLYNEIKTAIFDNLSKSKYLFISNNLVLNY